MRKAIRRGDLFYADLNPVVGSEQGGVRPVLIVQNEIGNRHSPTVIAAAITSRLDKARLPTHINIRAADTGLAKDSVVLLEQIRTIDKSRLESYIGRLDEATMSRIDRALGISVGIDRKIDWSDGIELCLCGKCASDFFNTPGHYIKRADKAQTIKDTCTYCNVRQGYDYIVVDR